MERPAFVTPRTSFRPEPQLEEATPPEEAEPSEGQDQPYARRATRDVPLPKVEEVSRAEATKDTLLPEAPESPYAPEATGGAPSSETVASSARSAQATGLEADDTKSEVQRLLRKNKNVPSAQQIIERAQYDSADTEVVSRVAPRKFHAASPLLRHTH